MALNPNAPDQIYQAFANHGPAIQAALLTDAKILFGALAVIELVWFIGWSVAHQHDIFDIMIATTRMAITLGFWFFLLQNWVQMAKAVTDTFGIWGNNAVTAAGGTPNMMPMGFLVAGLNLAHHIWNAMTIRDPITATLLALAGLVDIVIFGWIASLILLVVIEAFLASYLGTVMVAFGANSFSRNFGMSPIRYAIAVGMKRMTLQLIAGIGEILVNTFATQVQGNPGSIGWGDLGVMIVVPVILVALAWKAPNVAQDIIIGSHMSTSAGIVASARAIAGTVAAAAASVAGGGAAASASLQLAGRQMLANQETGQPPPSAVARGATMARLAAANLASATASDVGRRMTGNYGATHGHLGWRVAQVLNQQTGKKPG